ncbi:hypothetical protein LP419_26655 [Massilia sp. H-1]|nr:hypothetical protein LP419_26655 [Massilia sp. H-1]
MILQLARGYDTLLGDGGAGLSGGQAAPAHRAGARPVRRPGPAGAGRTQCQPGRRGRAGTGGRHQPACASAARQWC